MVNTRRMESSGLATDNGPGFRTRKSNDGEPVLGSSCDSDSGGQGEEEESAEEEDFSSSPEKVKNLDVPKEKSTSLASQVKGSRNRFVCEERKFNQLHLRKRELRSSHKHIANDRRRLRVYSPHKMHDDIDSEEDCYSPRHHSRRNHYSKSHLNRIERRTALSLRPITRKFYKDQSPVTCNSDDSDFIKVRRSMRTRNSGDKNMSWLTDDQMHKIGYPNLRRRYSDDEDSRDVQNHINSSSTRAIESKRKARISHDSIKKNSKYLYDYETEEMHSNHNKHCNNESEALRSKSERITEKNLRSSSRAESHDKENKEENILNGRGNGRLRRNRDVSAPKYVTVDGENDEDNGDNNDQNFDSQIDEEDEIAEDDDGEDEEETQEDEIINADITVPVNNKVDETENEEIRLEGKKTKMESTTYSPRRTRNRKISECSSSSAGVKGYSLRDRPPKNKTLMHSRDLEPIHPRRRFNMRKISSGSSSSDSSDSEMECRKNNKYSKNIKSPHSKNDQLKSGAGSNKIMPIGPETLDPKITFASVGGLDGHIRCLKEMILLPMMYPEVFQRFQIQPPRGVLFHGPPGTGKTLIARALVNECSFGSRKVNFFMRKGADLLSKWIGESEKQLRLLFQQAGEMKPSIIFFDELDGLAPVRSSRQDQIHASIVSTLLALIDGLDNRGEVIVIGATNRVDAIDPALRRPGRFDRELFFPLPAQKEREEILRVHVSKWTTPPNDQLILYLAENSIGYCGSDLRALCTEAVIQSFRRTYPQVYGSDHRLLLDPEQVKVEKLDFLRAKSLLLPASHRISQSVGRKLPSILEPLLKKPLKDVLSVLEKSFPHGLDPSLAKVKLSAAVRPSQMLLLGDGISYGHTIFLAPAILHHMEHIHAHVLDLAALHREGGRSPEEACIQVFHEAKRNVPSVIYIPNIDLLWSLVSETVLAIFVAQVFQINPNTPILILATADSLYKDIPEQISEMFSKYRNEVYEMELPTLEERIIFFKPLILEASIKPPRTDRLRVKTPPPLPRAPTPPPTPLTQEAAKKLYEQEERTLRELRIFLRDMCKKLASNRLFFMFTKPVDTEEVPDYPTIIKQPMDLETMMTKVDFHRYECAKDFLDDIELICQNALEYNPARTSADKQIRHRACSLRDYAFALIKNEMDSDFEDKCQEIATRRKQRKASIKQYLPPYLDISAPGARDDKIELKTPERKSNVQQSAPRTSPSRKRKIPSWQHGYLKKRKKKHRPTLIESLAEDQNDDKSSEDESKEHSFASEVEKSVKLENNESDEKSNTEHNPTAPLTVNCDTTTSTSINSNQECSSSLMSPSKRRLSDLLSPSELLDDPLELDDIDQALNEEALESSEEIISLVDISEGELKSVLDKAVTITKDQPLQSLLDLHFQLSRIVKKYIRSNNRIDLPKELLKELMRFKEENVT